MREQQANRALVGLSMDGRKALSQAYYLLFGSIIKDLRVVAIYHKRSAKQKLKGNAKQ
jgi:hypothetical protein